MNKSHLLYFLFLALFAASCSNTKYLPEGELLYTGASVKVEGKEISSKEKKVLKTALKSTLRPKPNSSILGLRPKLLIYNLAGTPKKEKGWRYWLKTKVGEAPVLFSQVDLEYSKSVLQNFSENSGYFNTKTEADSTRHGKKVTAEYIVKPGKQYKIREVKFPTDSSVISNAVRRTSRRSLLKKDNGYSLDIIKEERVRIDARLKEKGIFILTPIISKYK